VASAAQATEPLFADGEDDRHRQRFRPGQGPLGDGHGGRDGDRVVADPPAAQPAVALRDALDRRLAEDVIHVDEQGEAVRRRAERPDQVADAIDVPAAGRLPQPPL